jgi:hypothetical protein
VSFAAPLMRIVRPLGEADSMKRMGLSMERKIVSGFILLIAVATFTWLIISIVELQRALESAAKVGVIVDISQDSQQRDLRLTLALLLAAIAIWSRKGVKIALILFGVSYAVIEFLSGGVASKHGFLDRPEPEIHLIAGAILFIGILLWFRRANHLIITTLAPSYILFEYLVWYLETSWLRESGDEKEIYTPVWLNRLFFGADWWHILILISALIMIVWLIRITLKGKTKRHTAVEAV